MSSRVQWAKVAHDAVYLLFKGVMPETRFDFGLSQRCRRDAHRLLPTPQKRLRTSSLSILSLDPGEKEKRDKACSELLSGVSVENVLGTVSILVLAACDEVGPVRGKLQVRNDVALVREHLLAQVRVEQHAPARLVARQDQTLHIQERTDSGLAINWVKHRRRLEVLCTAHTSMVSVKGGDSKEGLHACTVRSRSRWVLDMRMAP